MMEGEEFPGPRVRISQLYVRKNSLVVDFIIADDHFGELRISELVS